MMQDFVVSGLVTDVFTERIFPANIHVRDGKIFSIVEVGNIAPGDQHYILPGFIDSHVHIESSMLIPSEFARIAVTHGTLATVSDPHEIANVCGINGVRFMIDDGNTVPFKFYFGAPSCVPATVFETAGASLSATEVHELLQTDDVKYLSEMMNFPGVLAGDEQVLKKIKSALDAGKPVDGHAPGLRGDEAARYIAAGISTDHECFSSVEALDKLSLGMKIIIREGSAAKNFDALIDLLNEYPDRIMFCSDDKHPDSLVNGHINELCARAIGRGIDIFKVLKAACVNPVLHYKLNVGLLRRGDPADFIVVENLENFKVLQAFINGNLVAENGESKIKSRRTSDASLAINNFHCTEKLPQEFEVPVVTSQKNIHVIGVVDGQLVTNKMLTAPKIVNDRVVSDIENDILKIVVVNRYDASKPDIAKAFIKNFGLKHGALASSVAHDSHNIVAVGVDDESLCRAVNLVISSKGGISCVNENAEMLLSLPVAGLMSDQDGYAVAHSYTAIDAMAKSQGSPLSAPFMSLSFMALLVIPHLKLSDLGLFDGDSFQFVQD